MILTTLQRTWKRWPFLHRPCALATAQWHLLGKPSHGSSLQSNQNLSQTNICDCINLPPPPEIPSWCCGGVTDACNREVYILVILCNSSTLHITEKDANAGKKMREGKYIIKHMCAANSHNTTFNSLSTTRKNMPMICPAESVTVSYNRHLKTASYCCLQLSWQLTAAESLLKFYRRWQKNVSYISMNFPS